jgi:hypothetical protein
MNRSCRLFAIRRQLTRCGNWLPHRSPVGNTPHHLSGRHRMVILQNLLSAENQIRRILGALPDHIA